MSVDSPDYRGRKWGYRILILVGYWIFFVSAGTIAPDLEQHPWVIKLVVTIFIFISSIVLIRATRNMFKRNFLRYGFFCGVFFLLSVWGSRGYNNVQKEIMAFMDSPQAKARKALIQKQIESGELPYSSYEEAKGYLFRIYPELEERASQLWIYELMRLSTVFPSLVYLVIFVSSGIRHVWLNRGKTTKDVEPLPEKSSPGGVGMSVIIREKQLQQERMARCSNCANEIDLSECDIESGGWRCPLCYQFNEEKDPTIEMPGNGQLPIESINSGPVNCPSCGYEVSLGEIEPAKEGFSCPVCYQFVPFETGICDSSRPILPQIVQCPTCKEDLELEYEERVNREFKCPLCGNKTTAEDF